ncbi:AraC-type DNA-binding protein [Geodermatophilus pulveris]|uniref:AraC-type DNA-binding protein n=1 Tax=Geodermatophilus pulveris TaxID=1564159 RepID=A0A239DQK7_9ACTN|nr:helix-turn-helix domain-containing protein [Geodermatophilus pulveris]SNS34013.1 AraC-type DNA-binding protein [Geodermatophilus pulveris]
MTYRERATAVPDAVLWERAVPAGASRILPDGCLDLLWDGRRLSVAGPDTRARWHEDPAPARYVALRFSGGTGPALLGVPAHELRDRTPLLEDLWPAAAARRLADRVAEDPVGALERWAGERVVDSPADPLGGRVLALARAGVPVAGMAARLGLGVRQLHRRSLDLFGYGPRHLTRVLRLGRALEQVRQGAPLARVAADSGYADQAHLARDVRGLTGTTVTALLRGSAG